MSCTLAALKTSSAFRLAVTTTVTGAAFRPLDSMIGHVIISASKTQLPHVQLCMYIAALTLPSYVTETSVCCYL